MPYANRRIHISCTSHAVVSLQKTFLFSCVVMLIIIEAESRGSLENPIVTPASWEPDSCSGIMFRKDSFQETYKRTSA